MLTTQKTIAVEHEELFESVPFALSIGPQRAGTSWLDRYLRSRSDVCVPSKVKEVMFFDKNFDRGLEFYKSHFSIEPSHRLAMEVTTTAFDDEKAVQRVYQSVGNNIRLLCPLRHPITRSYSLYLHYLRYGEVSGSLRDACFQKPQIIDSSRYAKHLKHWFSYFGQENIAFVFQEDLQSNQVQYLNEVCEALGVPYLPALANISGKYNSAPKKAPNKLAGLAQKCGDWLREHQYYDVINKAKDLGLKSFFFGQDCMVQGTPEIPEEDRLWLQEQLEGQVEELEKLIGPIPQWKNI